METPERPGPVDGALASSSHLALTPFGPPRLAIRGIRAELRIVVATGLIEITVERVQRGINVSAIRCLQLIYASRSRFIMRAR